MSLATNIGVWEGILLGAGRKKFALKTNNLPFYHSGFLSNCTLALKNRVCPEFTALNIYFLIIQDFWATCACPEIFHCIAIFLTIQDFWATLRLPEKFFFQGGCRSPAPVSFAYGHERARARHVVWQAQEPDILKITSKWHIFASPCRHALSLNMIGLWHDGRSVHSSNTACFECRCICELQNYRFLSTKFAFVKIEGYTQWLLMERVWIAEKKEIREVTWVQTCRRMIHSLWPLAGTLVHPVILWRWTLPQMWSHLWKTKKL